MNLIKTDINGIYKDGDSGALVNLDNAQLVAYKAKKQLIREISFLKKRMEILESEIQDLKLKKNK